MIDYNSNIKIVQGESIMLFSTASCNPCKNMKTILMEFEKIHGDKISFYNIDTSLFPELAKQHKIKSVPTTLFLKNSKVIDRFAGFLDNVDLESKMMNLLYDFESEMDLNMDDF